MARIMMVQRNQSKQALVFLILCCSAAAARGQSPEEWRKILTAGGGASEPAVQAAGRIVSLLTRDGGLDWPEHIAGVDPDLARLNGYVNWRLKGEPPPKPVPEDVAGELRELAGQVERTVDDAALSGCAGCRTDLRALALLGRYHARRITQVAELSLFNASGDLSALRAAVADAAAGTELWERLLQAIDPPGVLFGPPEVASCRRDAVVVRRRVQRLMESEHTLFRYGLFDLGFDFGPRRNAGPDGRFTILYPGSPFWRGKPVLRSSEPAPDVPLFGGYLQGTGNAMLATDLPPGEYRVACVVINRPDVAGGSFEIRVGNGVISYDAGETGEKSTNASVTAGRLTVEFVPGSGGDWLVSGLVITRRVPHIGWVPVRSAALDAPLFVSPTITAPDGVRQAALQCDGVPGRPMSVSLQGDGGQFSARVDWARPWGSIRPRCRIVASDSRGVTAATLPAEIDWKSPR
jgi:hypothetical protein